MAERILRRSDRIAAKDAVIPVVKRVSVQNCDTFKVIFTIIKSMMNSIHCMEMMGTEHVTTIRVKYELYRYMHKKCVINIIRECSPLLFSNILECSDRLMGELEAIKEPDETERKYLELVRMQRDARRGAGV